MTELIYMTAPEQREGSATVQEITEMPDGRPAIILDQTIFYPQGGGQPYDTGSIDDWPVTDVRFIEGLVYHIGETPPTLEKGQTVSLKINAERRQLNTKLHSLGHLLDEAVYASGYDWLPTKGYHFPDGPWVEYQGELTPEVYEAFAKQIEEKLNEMIQTGYDVDCRFVEREKLEEVCRFVLPNIPKDKPTRVVTIWGDLGIPCGGTHVQNISELGQAKIEKVKTKKGLTKIKYSLAA